MPLPSHRQTPAAVAGFPTPGNQAAFARPHQLEDGNDSKIVFGHGRQAAGLTVIYDPDFPARRISVELTNVTLEQALDIVSLPEQVLLGGR